MIHLIEKIAKVTTILICPFLAYGFGMSLFQAVSLNVVPHSLPGFLVGFVSFALIWRAFRRHLSVVCTFEHEITHVLFGLMFLKVPRSFVVTRHEGGHVTMTGGNFLITLAPYFFPTVSYVLLPLSFLFTPKYLPLFFGVLGASVAFHIASTWAEIHWQQTDLHEAGIAFSLLFLPVANLIFYGALMAVIFGGREGFFKFWVYGFQESFLLIEVIFR